MDDFKPAMRPHQLGGLLGAILILIGPFGPYASIGAIAVTPGLRGDGVLAFSLGVAAIVLTAYGRAPLLGFGVGVAAIVTAAIDIGKVQPDAGDSQLIQATSSTGWGVILVLVGGIIVALWGAYAMWEWQQNREPRTASEASSRSPALAPVTDDADDDWYWGDDR